MPIVKGCIKMGIISTDTLERSDTRSVEMLIIQMAKKGNTAKQKAPCNQDYRRLEGTWQNSAVSSPESVRVTRLLAGARAPRAEHALAEAGVALVLALRGRVTGLSPGGCWEERPGCASATSCTRALVPAAFICLLYLFVPRARCCNRFPWFPITKTLTTNHRYQTGYLGFAVLDLFV